MKFKLIENSTFDELNRTITKSNRTLVEDESDDIKKQREQLEESVYSIIEDYIGRNRVDAFGVKYNKEMNMFVIEITLAYMPPTSDFLMDTRDAMEDYRQTPH